MDYHCWGLTGRDGKAFRTLAGAGSVGNVASVAHRNCHTGRQLLLIHLHLLSAWLRADAL